MNSSSPPPRIPLYSPHDATPIDACIYQEITHRSLPAKPASEPQHQGCSCLILDILSGGMLPIDCFFLSFLSPHPHLQPLLRLLPIQSFQEIRLPRLTIPLGDRLPHIPFEGSVQRHVQCSVRIGMNEIPVHKSQSDPRRIDFLKTFLTATYKKNTSLLHTHG